MSQLPISDAQAAALADFVEPFVCPIHVLKKGDDREPPGDHWGTGWFYGSDADPLIVTCEHVARMHRPPEIKLGYECSGSGFGITVDSAFVEVPHPVDAARATIKKYFRHLEHNGQCVPRALVADAHRPVPGELLYVYGFPGMDAASGFGMHSVVGTCAFLREVELNPAVFTEDPPHPAPEKHISLAWSPESARPLLGTRGSLSLPNGMSGSPLWNTRYEEIALQGGEWKPSDARVTGMVWGHSAKAGQLYATPIETLIEQLFGHLQGI